ncbi:protein of unknown function [Citrobacter amalonaticus]|uniref:Uncharacterized protein n=1 Tax=Citrobacter amalonaticus TaxID=35703 RepID=A0AAX2BCT6_CITAM|nr:protein of unknown function [Citrobacter amalonaticus]SAZ20610.1 protein of unknown function [Citrobacter amalonaticus]
MRQATETGTSLVPGSADSSLCKPIRVCQVITFTHSCLENGIFYISIKVIVSIEMTEKARCR